MKTIFLQQLLRISGVCLVLVALMSCADEESPVIPYTDDDVPIDTLIWLNAGEQFNIPIDTYKGSAKPTATLVDVFGTVRAVPADIMRIANRQWIVVKSTNLELVTGSFVVRLQDSIVLAATIIVKAKQPADPKLLIPACRYFTDSSISALRGEEGGLFEILGRKLRRLDARNEDGSWRILSPRLNTLIGIVDARGLFSEIFRWNYQLVPYIQAELKNGSLDVRFVRCITDSHYRAVIRTALDTIYLANPRVHVVPLGAATECFITLYEGDVIVAENYYRSEKQRGSVTMSINSLHTVTAEHKIFSANDTAVTITQDLVEFKHSNSVHGGMSVYTFRNELSMSSDEFDKNLWLKLQNGKVEGGFFFPTPTFFMGRIFYGGLLIRFRNATLNMGLDNRSYSIDMNNAEYSLKYQGYQRSKTDVWYIASDTSWRQVTSNLTIDINLAR